MRDDGGGDYRQASMRLRIPTYISNRYDTASTRFKVAAYSRGVYTTDKTNQKTKQGDINEQY
jgi:hypothetical protein